MLAVQDDWIQYEEVPARRTAVRGGAACRTRVPVVGERVAVPRPAPLRTAPRSVGSRPGRLRLTRRGRVVLVVLPAVALLAAACVATGAGTPPASADPAVPRTVPIRAGDSLWAVAVRLDPAGDPRETVASLQEENGLTSSRVSPGQVLVVPAALPGR